MADISHGPKSGPSTPQSPADSATMPSLYDSGPGAKAMTQADFLRNFGEFRVGHVTGTVEIVQK